MRRFNQEATVAAALNYPNVAHIYEIGESEGTIFIAMEFTDGQRLREKIHRDKAPGSSLLCGGQVHVVHDGDETLIALRGHDEIQQTPPQRDVLTLPVLRSGHLPPRVNRRHVKLDKPDLDLRYFQVRVFKLHREPRRVKLLNFRPPMRDIDSFLSTALK